MLFAAITTLGSSGLQAPVYATCMLYASPRLVYVGCGLVVMTLDVQTGRLKRLFPTDDAVMRLVMDKRGLSYVEPKTLHTPGHTYGLPWQSEADQPAGLYSWKGLLIVPGEWENFYFDGLQLRHFDPGDAGTVIAMNQNGEAVAVGGKQPAVGLFRMAEGKLRFKSVQSIGGNYYVADASFLAGAGWVFTSFDGRVRIFRGAGHRSPVLYRSPGTIPSAICSDGKSLLCVAFQNNSKKSVPGSRSRLVLLSISKGRVRVSVIRRGTQFAATAIAPDGSSLLATDDWGRLWGWRLHTAQGGWPVNATPMRLQDLSPRTEDPEKQSWKMPRQKPLHNP